MGDLRAFIDTNVILDHLEGKVDLLEIREKIGTLYSNIIVFSEAFMVYLKAITGERAYTLKHNPEIITNKKDELKNIFHIFIGHSNLLFYRKCLCKNKCATKK